MGGINVFKSQWVKIITQRGISMESIFSFVTALGISVIFVTPLTLIVGVINAIKKPDKEAKPYTIMAIISAYLIIIPIIGISM